MDVYKELCDLKETIANEITQANKEIKKSGGDLNSGDIEMIDKLTHSMKSLITACAMLEAEENGYTSDYMQDGGSYRGGYSSRRGYSRENRNGGGYSGNYGSYARNESRYSRENRNGGGYSRGMDWNEHLRMMMDEAPDEATRMDIKKLMDRMS
ncbi:MAG: hypothetical protein J6U01_09435 [Clostridia bacterium]|nr:hypothetical protein [Clostridia bacterium]